MACRIGAERPRLENEFKRRQLWPQGTPEVLAMDVLFQRPDLRQHQFALIEPFCVRLFVTFASNFADMKFYLRVVLLSCVCFFGGGALGQDSTAVAERYVRVVLNDGSIKEGLFIAMDADVLVLDLPTIGPTRIPKYTIQMLQDIESISKSAGGIANRAFDVNPQSSRYFFAPSGIQLKKGEGYFQSNIGLNSISYGINDGLTVGGIVSFLGGGGSFKLGKAITEKTFISAGGIGFADFYEILDQPLGLAFINVTHGTERSNVTLNLGFGNEFKGPLQYRNYVRIENEFEVKWIPLERANSKTRPFIGNISAMVPIGDTRWLLTENYLIKSRLDVTNFETNLNGWEVFYSEPTGAPVQPGVSWKEGVTSIVSLGIRSLNRRSGWLWDYGLVGVVGPGGTGFAAPWFSFTLAF